MRFRRQFANFFKRRARYICTARLAEMLLVYELVFLGKEPASVFGRVRFPLQHSQNYRWRTRGPCSSRRRRQKTDVPATSLSPIFLTLHGGFCGTPRHALGYPLMASGDRRTRLAKSLLSVGALSVQSVGLVCSCVYSDDQKEKKKERRLYTRATLQR